MSTQPKAHFTLEVRMQSTREVVSIPVNRAQDLSKVSAFHIRQGNIVMGYTIPEPWEGRPWVFKSGTRHFSPRHI